MHHVIDTTVQIDILLHACLRGHIFVLWAAATVMASLNGEQNLLNERLNDRHDDSDEHGTDQRIANDLEPCSIEVPETPADQTESQRTRRHVCIDEEEEDSCIDELHPKDNFGRAEQSLCLLIITQSVDQGKCSLSQEDIENDNRELEALDPEYLLPLQLIVNFANLDAFGVPMIGIECSLVVHLELLLAVALVGSVRMVSFLRVQPVEILQRKSSQFVPVHFLDEDAVDGGEHI